MTAFAVGSGGFLGSLTRYGLSVLVQRHGPPLLSAFPLATLVVNLVGCLGVGMLAGFAESRQVLGAEFRAFVVVGFLGGLTTFSAFGYETYAMVRQEEYIRAVLNVISQVVLGIVMVWLGYNLTDSR